MLGFFYICLNIILCSREGLNIFAGFYSFIKKDDIYVDKSKYSSKISLASIYMILVPGRLLSGLVLLLLYCF